MNYLILIVLATLAFASYANANQQDIHLFILSGQSNMAGLHPKTTFSPPLGGEYGKKKTKVAQNALGGEPNLPRDKKKKTKKPAAAVPHFNNISKADFTSGKHKQLTIPYVDGGVQKYGVATYNSGRYVIMRDIGINADGATYDYWRGK